MQDIGRIRTLIEQGKTDAEIFTVLSQEAQSDNSFSWDNPGRFFRSLALTMRKAKAEQRRVAAHEVLPQLGLFRLMWEELVANGDSAKVEKVVADLLCKVTGEPRVADSFIRLHEDFKVLSLSAGDTPDDALEARAVVERRYGLDVRGESVICGARAGAAVAEALDLMYSVVGADARYPALFPAEVLSQCLPVLAMPRPSWTEMLQKLNSGMRKAA